MFKCRSLGLAVAPRVRFLQKKASTKKTDEDLDLNLEANSDSDISVNEKEETRKEKKAAKQAKSKVVEAKKSTITGKTSGPLKSYDFSLPGEFKQKVFDLREIFTIVI